MKLLDLFCKAGGTSMGYHLAGFEITGVDIESQPRFPFNFIQEDALEYVREFGYLYDAICASPPCQEYTKAGKQWRLQGKEYSDLIATTRTALIESGKPYIIENVPGAPLINPILLNGSLFGLLVHRPRLFECSFYVKQPEIPKTKRPVKMGRKCKQGDIIQPVGHFSGVQYAREQMQIDWMTGAELSQAIPPAYTEHLGKLLMAQLTNK